MTNQPQTTPTIDELGQLHVGIDELEVFARRAEEAVNTGLLAERMTHADELVDWVLSCARSLNWAAPWLDRIEVRRVGDEADSAPYFAGLPLYSLTACARRTYDGQLVQLQRVVSWGDRQAMGTRPADLATWMATSLRDAYAPVV